MSRGAVKNYCRSAGVDRGFALAARGGFSLLELLIAFVVFAVAMAGVMSVLGEDINNSAALNDYDGAVRLARWKMGELRQLENFSEDEITGEEGKYTWLAYMETVDTEDIPMHVEEDDSESNYSPALLIVEVNWKEDEGSEKLVKFKLEGYKAFKYAPK